MRRLSDPLLLWLAVSATLVGLGAIWSAALGHSESAFPKELRNQALFAVFCVVVAMGVSRLNPSVPRKLAWPAYILSMLALVLVLLPAFGLERNGSRRWFALFSGFTVQPSEFAKLACILLAAGILAVAWPAPTDKRKTMHWTDWMDRIAVPTIWRWSPLLFALLAMFLIALEPDLETGALIVVAVLAMLCIAGAPWKWLFAVVAVGGLLAVAFVFAEPYRLERFTAHAHRWEPSVRREIGYQGTLSEAAMAEGSLFGKGIGDGDAKQSLPTATSDFILTTIAEETGLFGSGLVLALLAAICARIYQLSQRTTDRFAKLVLVGIATWLATQTALNVLMANGALPPIGVPLPFISYGGSSLLAGWLAIAVCQCVSVRAPEVNKAAQARSNRWWNRRARVSRA